VLELNLLALGIVVEWWLCTLIKHFEHFHIIFNQEAEIYLISRFIAGNELLS